MPIMTQPMSFSLRPAIVRPAQFGSKAKPTANPALLEFWRQKGDWMQAPAVLKDGQPVSRLALLKALAQAIDACPIPKKNPYGAAYRNTKVWCHRTVTNTMLGALGVLIQPSSILEFPEFVRGAFEGNLAYDDDEQASSGIKRGPTYERLHNRPCLTAEAEKYFLAQFQPLDDAFQANYTAGEPIPSAMIELLQMPRLVQRNGQKHSLRVTELGMALLQTYG